MPRRRRDPVSDLPARLQAVIESDRQLRETEATHEQARERFRRALREAHEAGATYEQLGKLVGLSRQRIGVLVRD
jgi:hypothetical protein